MKGVIPKQAGMVSSELRRTGHCTASVGRRSEPKVRREGKWSRERQRKCPSGSLKTKDCDAGLASVLDN